MYLFGTQPMDGTEGWGPLIQGIDGNLYGVTSRGGANSTGVVFRMSLSGTYQKIFDLSGPTEGVYPNPLTQTSNGILWSATSNTGAALGGGAAFAIDANGTFQEATFFTNPTGKTPLAGMFQASDGKLYGTTTTQGTGGSGTVYVVDAALAPPAPGTAGASSAPMLVTAFDKATGDITVGYGPACYAPDHHIVYGPLSSVSTYAYSGEACNLGNTGVTTFNPGSGDFFWVIVGNTPALEGSYSKRSSGAERPPAALAGCPYVQDLSTQCP